MTPARRLAAGLLIAVVAGGLSCTSQYARLVAEQTRAVDAACADATRCIEALRAVRYLDLGAPATSSRLSMRLSGFGLDALPALAAGLAPGPRTDRGRFRDGEVGNIVARAVFAMGRPALDHALAHMDVEWPIVVLFMLTQEHRAELRPVVLTNLRHHVDWIRGEFGAWVPPFSRPLGLSLVVELGRDAGFLMEPLSQLLEEQMRDRWWAAAGTVEALGYVGDESVVPILVRALDHHDWVLAHSACKALASIGPAATGALEPLRRVAATHWFTCLRRAAAVTIRIIDSSSAAGPEKDACARGPQRNDVQCEISCFSTGGWLHCEDRKIAALTWKGKRYPLTSPTRPAPAELPDVVLKGMEQDVSLKSIGSGFNAGDTLRIPGGWLAAADGFESNASVLAVVRDADLSVEVLANDPFIRLVDHPDGVFAIASESVYGGLVWQVRNLRGRWQARPFARIPWYAWDRAAVADDGTLLVTTTHGHVAVERDGRVTSLGCGE